jgi:putative oxidoreductase
VFGGDMSDTVSQIKAVGLPAPSVFAWATAVIELGGGALIATGLFTRAAAGIAAVTMFGASFLVHNASMSESRELALAYLVSVVALACMGAGKWSLDGVVRKSA